MEYKEIDVTAIAREFFLEELLAGGQLGRLLSSQLSNSSGPISTYVPTLTSSQRLREFRHGGIASREITVSHLVSAIREHLDMATSHCAIFETPWRWTDPVVRTLRQCCFWVDEEVFEFCAGPQYDSESIKKCVAKARSYPFIAALTSPTPSEGSEPKTLLTQLAQDALKVVVGAYDSEAFLYWL